MEKFRTAMIHAAGYLAGAVLLVAGWWISMLNISIDRFQGTDFTNFWTLLGLVLIFIGAYLPIVIAKWRSRTVRRHHAELERAAQRGAAAVMQVPEGAGAAAAAATTAGEADGPQQEASAPDTGDPAQTAVDRPAHGNPGE